MASFYSLSYFTFILSFSAESVAIVHLFIFLVLINNFLAEVDGWSIPGDLAVSVGV